MLGLRLFSIQILKSADLSRQAVRQRAQSIVLFDGRGDIQDRRRQSLLDGRREMGLVAFPVLYRGEEEKIRQYLSGLLALDKITAPAPDRLPFWASPLIAGPLPPELADLPGLIPAPRTRRFGPDALASHLVGYIRESEGIGVSGIERAFDDELSKGGETRLAALVDGRNRLIPGLGYRIQQKGGRSLNVVLSVDRKLQREVERIMDLYVRQGAVVVMDPFNGDILALASRPDFKAGDLAQALAGEQDSLLNRALWDYQPGSVFKTVTAAAALEEELAGLFDTFNCFGGVYVDGLFFPCSNLHSKQQITLVEAFAYSCNSVFIELALKLGPEKLDGYARRFGFAEPVGLPVGERPGRLPPLADISRPRALANLALGQGEMLATPVQVAAMISPFANGGRLIEPRLVLGLTDYYGREQKNFLPKRGNVVLSPAVLHKMNYLLQAVTMQGTGRAAGLSGSATAGMKTGTAESGRLKDNRPVYNYWAAGFYPLEKTRYVIVVFADDLKRGSAAKVFGEIINNILHKN
jgi:peptidoglycan glycosyltransferase/penicillin-binding protein 2